MNKDNKPSLVFLLIGVGALMLLALTRKHAPTTPQIVRR